jgi:hypothetical protein
MWLCIAIIGTLGADSNDNIVFGHLGPAKIPVVLLVGRAQSVSRVFKSPFLCSDAHILVNSYYEGHPMELVTYATRVCKILGVEMMVGTLRLRSLVLPQYGPLTPSNNSSDECCWWIKS